MLKNRGIGIMEKIYLKDINDNKMLVEFVRFFQFKNTKYLIYTKNESDEKGYIKLYPVKIMDSLGEKIARSIKDETEWKNLQQIVKKVIREIRNAKIESFIDLDKRGIENLKIVDCKFFKLDPKLVDILSSDDMLGIKENVKLDTIKEDEKIEFENIIDMPINESSNYLVEKTFDQNSIWNENASDESTIEDNDLTKELEENNDYKKMYDELLKEKNELSDILTNIIIELTNYKVKYGELKQK